MEWSCSNTPVQALAKFHWISDNQQIKILWAYGQNKWYSVSFFTDSLVSFWTKTWISNQIGLVKNGKQHCSFWTKLDETSHSASLVGTSSSLPLPPLSFWYIQASASTQASTDTQQKRFEPAAQCAVTAPLRVMYTATVPNQISKNKIWEAKTDKMWPIVDVRSDWFLSSFILKKTQVYFLDKNLWKRPQCTHCCSSLYTVGELPSFCLPLLASSQLGDK